MALKPEISKAVKGIAVAIAAAFILCMAATLFARLIQPNS